MSDEAPVTRRECDNMHEMQEKRLDSIDRNFVKVFEKLDDIAAVKGRVNEVDKKTVAIGNKMDSHIDKHFSFVFLAMGILTLASVIVAIVAFMLYQSKVPRTMQSSVRSGAHYEAKAIGNNNTNGGTRYANDFSLLQHGNNCDS